MDYHSALKTNSNTSCNMHEACRHAKCNKPGRKVNYWMTPSVRCTSIRQFVEIDSRVDVARCRGGVMASFVPGHRASVWDDKKVQKIILVMVAQHCACALGH